MTQFVKSLKEKYPDYSKAEVSEMWEKLGPFDFVTARRSDASKRIFKSETVVENRAMYYGEWNEGTGEKHGMGVLVWPSGDLYEGYWKHNQQNGKGRLIHANKDVYTGDWKDDKAHGQGEVLHADGTSYTGEWYLDKRHGQGREAWVDGSFFEGQYVDGKKQGQGFFKWADGSTY